ncbi:MAG: DUF104 domain-containing protein [Defluviitaleaceae bacterium]|nr:DUF104 domain-containing protein [Defluviitaleaceae bacterium]
MYAVEAIYDGITFKPTQPVDIKEEYKVIITFVEPVKQDIKKDSKYLVEPDPSKSGAVALGLWEGQVKIPDDFNEPLEDLKEYMY